MSAIKLTRLTFLGPDVAPSQVSFGPGLNVFYGPTETGKSFIIEAIDFMFGGKELRQIPESLKYDVVVLWITLGEVDYTLQRSTDGKAFLWSQGHQDRLILEKSEVLSATHSPTNEKNLSRRLLSLLGLANKVVAKSKDDTRGLSFRDLAHLSIIDEDSMWAKISPVLSANNVENPSRKSVFRLALSGVDASSLVSLKESNERIAPLKQQKEAISSLTLKYAERTSGTNEGSVRTRFNEIEGRLREMGTTAEAEENEYQQAQYERRRYSEHQEAAASRYRRLDLLLSRFDLLDSHYRSDLARLEAIAEAGSIFNAIHGGDCPVCGAAPDQHRSDSACSFDTEGLLEAVKAESLRIVGLRAGLAESVTALRTDMSSAQQREAESEEAKGRAEARARHLLPIVRDMRRGMASLNTEMSSLQRVVSHFDVIDAFNQQLIELDQEIAAVAPPEKSADLSLSPAISASFAESVELTLQAWGLPDANRVAWDSTKFDIQIGLRRRGDRGKGIRAITCAGFVLTLMSTCLLRQNPHAGFVLMDSPLLAYWKPDDQDDDLSATDVDTRFYRSLSDPRQKGQIVIVDNRPPPPWLSDAANVVHFTKSAVGRYGLFPPIES
jgi:uncharacterized protein YydD (DUF2326 family)